MLQLSTAALQMIPKCSCVNNDHFTMLTDYISLEFRQGINPTPSPNQEKFEGESIQNDFSERHFRSNLVEILQLLEEAEESVTCWSLSHSP